MTFADQLIRWYEKAGRKELPWLHYSEPYPIWVSEIMLQQTQVATVIPYFERFIKRFPSVSSLAAARLDEVLEHWTGLGYYARGRNLHASAVKIVEEFSGKFPQSVEQLESLPGIGCSTAGAIVAQAFQQRAPILDGNVKRVLTRYHAIEEWPGSTQVTKQLWKLAEEKTPDKKVRIYTQAIMDLGATVCTRSNPECDRCPLESECEANRHSLQRSIPARKPAKAKPIRKTHFLILENEASELFLVKRPPTGIWGGLWSFPEIEDKEVNSLDVLETLPERQHTFSHFQLQYTPVKVRYKPENTKVMEAQQSLWYNVNQPPSIGLAAPVLKLIKEITGSR